MDAKKLKINRLRKIAENQTLPFKEVKNRMAAAGIPVTPANLSAIGAAADAHPMSLLHDPKKVDQWIVRYLTKLLTKPTKRI